MSQNPFQQNTGANHANPYAYEQIVAQAGVSERVQFIRNTYAHLAGAVIAFVLLETLMLTLFWDQLGTIVTQMVSGYAWLIVLGAFMLVSWVADRWANSNTSRGMQYAGLALYVVAEAIIFLPILYIAQLKFPGSIASAGIVTAIVFTGLTAVVFLTKADFSFLRMALWIGGFAAIAAILVSFVLPFSLGPWFSIAMIVFASGYILYTTSNILHHYNTSQYVAAALALFASVALLFWYILRLFMQFAEE